MKSIRNQVMNEIVIEKSRFITYLFPIHSLEEAKEIVNNLNKEYNDATHVVYAFISESDTRSNDNGEPKGTAGLPTLEVLRKEDMTNILAATIRYFGGIKLGAGGLVRAYTRGVSEALKLAEITTEKDVIKVELRLTYRDSSYFDKLYQNSSMTKEYSLDVTYRIDILKEDFNSFKDLFLSFKDEYSFRIIEEVKCFI